MPPRCAVMCAEQLIDCCSPYVHAHLLRIVMEWRRKRLIKVFFLYFGSEANDGGMEIYLCQNNVVSRLAAKNQLLAA